MARLYYDCPLKAAYMAKEFGVRLVCYPTKDQAAEYGTEKPWDWGSTCDVDGNPEIEMLSDALKYLDDITDKIYIHPDSMDMFKPKCGDMCSASLPGDPILHTFPWPREDKIGYELHEIIKRDNKHFFMPEEEKDD